MASPMSSLNQIIPQMQKYYDPYINAGTSAIPGLQEQYGNLINDPGGQFNKMGESFQQSPGFDWQMQQALQGSNHAAAAGGMAGSPEHEQQNQQMANDMANQDYYNYMNHVTGLYNTGLSGEQDIMHQGFGATKSLTDQIAQTLAAESQLQAQKQNSTSSIFGDFAEGAGMGTMMHFLPMMAGL